MLEHILGGILIYVCVALVISIWSVEKLSMTIHWGWLIVIFLLVDWNIIPLGCGDTSKPVTT